MIHESNVDLIFITEIWLTEKGSDVAITELTPPVFKLHSNARKGRTGDMICVLYKHFLNIKLEKIEEFTSFQYTKVAVADITIVCIYHPPPSRKNKGSNNIFVEEMADLLNKIINSCRQIIVLGDFNLNFDSFKETYAKSMRSVLSDSHLHQIIEKPT